MLRPGRLAYFYRPEDAGGKSVALGGGASVRVDGPGGGRRGRAVLVVASGEKTYRWRRAPGAAASARACSEFDASA